MTGIYKITNNINGNSYIGQSVNIEKRWRSHRYCSSLNNESSNYPLYRAIRKYSLENFSFEVLEECLVSQLDEREVYWIAYYNTFFNGYNQGPGGQNGGTLSFKTKGQIIGVIADLETTQMTHREIAKKWDISQEMVQGINTGRYWKQDREYPIQKRYRRLTSKRLVDPRKISRKPFVCCDCGVKITSGATRCASCAKIASRKVERPTKEILEQEVAENSFVSLGKKYGVSDNAIRKWCVSYGIPTKKEKKEKIPQRPFQRPVAQVSVETGEVLNTFQSTAEASRAIDKPLGSAHISAVALGKRKTAYGFSWRYLD